MNSSTYFYRDKPLFGLDIGFSSVKAMQIQETGKQQVVTGYGVSHFEPTAIKDGVIVSPERIAQPLHDLFKKGLIGEITTHRVIVSIPAVRTF